MKQKRYRIDWKVFIYITLILPISIYSLSATEVKAEQQLAVSVKIKYYRWGGCSDGDGPPDIYWNVWIDDTRYQTPEYSGPFDPPIIDVNDPDWAIEIPAVLVDYSNGTIPIEIQQWDEDDFLAGKDDFCDINPDPNKKYLELVLDLKTREISGDATGYAGQIRKR
jgi:hypothetical protein